MAKRFKFRFETMLKLRRQREEKHQRIVAERLRQIHQVREQLHSIENQIRSEQQAITSAQRPGVIDLQQAIRHRHWIGHLHKCSLEAASRMRYLEAELAQERAALLEATKQRKILDKLKERQQERWQQEEDRLDAKATDEMSTIRFVYQQHQDLEPVSTS